MNQRVLPALLVALALAVAPAAAQNDTSGPPSCEDCPGGGGDADNETAPSRAPPCEDRASCQEYCEERYGTSDPAQCRRMYCEDHPDMQACRGPGDMAGETDDGPRSNGTTDGRRTNASADGRAPDEHERRHARCIEAADTREEAAECRVAFCQQRSHAPMCREDAAAPDWCAHRNGGLTDRCAAWKQTGGGLQWISFEVQRDPPGLDDYAVRDHLILESLRLDVGGGLELHAGGHVLEVRGKDGLLRIHDAPTGLLEFRSKEGRLMLDLPDDARVEERGAQGAGPAGWVILYADGTRALLRTDDAQWSDGNVLDATGFVSLHVPAAEPHRDRPLSAADQHRVEEAKERGRLGAEVRVSRPGQSAGPDVAGVTRLPDDAQVFAYDDVQVTVDPVPQVARNTTPLRVVVSAELEEGRTVSIEADPGLFPGLAAAGPSGVHQVLDLRYYDIHDDGSETEVVFRQADSLDDALDPTDDGGQPEYWIVHDQDGLQVLVSVPHWSAHAITLASVVEVLTEPPVIVGIAAGIGGAVAAAAVMLWPRRRED